MATTGSGSPSPEPAAEALAGSCLCGGVRYRARGPLQGLVRCCCRECRKASGAEFATNGSVTREHFELVSGESLLREYASSPGQYRVFCGQCGSPVFKRYDAQPDLVRLRLGCLDTPLDQKPAAQIFTSERLGLTRPDPDLPTFERMPND